MQSYIKTEAKNLVEQALKSAFDLPSDNIEGVLPLVVYPPDSKLGHVAFPCHSLSKTLRVSPIQIASVIRKSISNLDKQEIFDRTDASAGYVNFYVDFNALQRKLCLKWSRVSHLKNESNSTAKVSVEYAQLNTHKVYHVGHLRNIVLGDCISNLIDSTGKQSIRTIYPGDMGTHISKVLWYIRNIKKSELPSEKGAEWLGDMYGEADEYLKSISGTALEVKVRQEMSVILKNLEEEQGDYLELYQQTRIASLELMHSLARG